MTRRHLALPALAAVVALAACGGDADPERTFDPFASIEPIDETRPRAAPRWERVAALDGSGPTTASIEIAERAIQWRASWTCESGTFRVRTGPRGEAPQELGVSECPAEAEASSIETGPLRLAVEASGTWRLVLEQQVDTPLREPPLPDMEAVGARLVAEGDMYGIDKEGYGRAEVYRLPDGRTALRLEDFGTSANVDLVVWLSTAARPVTTIEAFRAPHRYIARLKSTVGEQNYLIPGDVAVEEFRSVVIWCPPQRTAYAAASLQPRT